LFVSQITPLLRLFRFVSQKSPSPYARFPETDTHLASITLFTPIKSAIYAKTRIGS
jgi:hypothetical protein